MIWAVLLIVSFWIMLGYLAKKDMIWSISLLLLLVPSYLIRFDFFGMPTTLLELGIYFLFLLYLLDVLKGKIKICGNKFCYLAIIWIGIGLISALFVSSNKIASLGLWKGWFVDPVLVFVLVITYLRHKAQVVYFYYGFLFLIGFLSTFSLWQLLSNSIITDDGRVSAFYASANYLALILVPSLLFVLAKFLLRKKFVGWEFLLWLIGVVVLSLTASYVGIFGLVIGILFMAWIINTRNFKNFFLVVIGGLVIFSLFLISQVHTARFQRMSDFSQRSSVSVRFEVWQTAWAMIKDNPVWGIGLGNFEQKYLEYAPKLFHPPMEWRILHAHDLYLQMWLDLSVFGLILFIAILLYMWILNVMAVKKYYAYWSFGILAIIFYWVLAGFFDISYMKNDLSFVFWLFVGLSATTGNLEKINHKRNK